MSPLSVPATQSFRRGMTLVELMVVLMILSVLAAFTLPLFKSNTQTIKLREASRLLNAQVAAAKSKAASLNRPVGVYIERRANSPNESTTLYLTETPPPFAGASESSRVLIRQLAPNTSGTSTLGSLVVEFPPNDLESPLILQSVLFPNPNSQTQGPKFIRMRFNYTGPWYRLQAALDQNDALTLTFNDLTHQCHGGDGDASGCPRNLGQPLPYQILLPPVRSYESPVQLPAGVIVDLNFSGFDANGNEFVYDPAMQTTTDSEFGPAPALIMFTPGGQVDRVIGTGTLQPLQNVHLLVGKAERVVFDTIPESNLADPENYWVSVTALTGKVTTTENIATKDSSGGPIPVENIFEARRYANIGSDVGGL